MKGPLSHNWLINYIYQQCITNQQFIFIHIVGLHCTLAEEHHISWFEYTTLNICSLNISLHAELI